MLRLHLCGQKVPVVNEEAFLRHAVNNLSIDQHRRDRTDLRKEVPIEELDARSPLIAPESTPEETLEAQQRLNRIRAVPRYEGDLSFGDASRFSRKPEKSGRPKKRGRSTGALESGISIALSYVGHSDSANGFPSLGFGVIIPFDINDSIKVAASAPNFKMFHGAVCISRPVNPMTNRKKVCMRNAHVLIAIRAQDNPIGLGVAHEAVI
jgi:hypothetical protein